MSDKITFEFDKNQIISKFLGSSSENNSSSDQLLEKYVNARLEIDKIKRDQEALESRNKILTQTLSEVTKILNKSGQKNKDVSMNLYIAKVKSKLYLDYSKNLYDLATTMLKNHTFNPSIVCSICQNSLDHEAFEYIELTGCEHYFHETCLNKYLDDDNDNCPNCRAVINTMRLGYFEKEPETKFIYQKFNFHQSLKRYLKQSQLVNIKTLDDLEDEEEGLAIYDYDNYLEHQNQYQEADILISEGSDNLILGSIVSQFIEPGENQNDGETSDEEEQ